MIHILIRVQLSHEQTKHLRHAAVNIDIALVTWAIEKFELLKFNRMRSENSACVYTVLVFHTPHDGLPKMTNVCRTLYNTI